MYRRGSRGRGREGARKGPREQEERRGRSPRSRRRAREREECDGETVRDGVVVRREGEGMGEEVDVEVEVEGADGDGKASGTPVVFEPPDARAEIVTN
jgi:uncharacterized phage protein gp47/JayE